MAKKYNAVVNSEKDVSQTFIKGAAILTLSMVIVKVFGLLDKVILANIYSLYGDQYATMGMGLYSNAFEIFVVIFTVATGGLPIAISRLISESMAEKRYNDTRLIHKISVPFFVAVGIICFFIMVFGGLIYVNYIIKSPYSVYAMMCLAPTVLFGCLVSIYRGYFEGQRNMLPTAISEIIEAGVKLVFGALFAYLIMKYGMAYYNDHGTVFGLVCESKAVAQNTILAFSVAGAIMGISLGSFCAFIFLLLKYKIGGDGIPEEYYQTSIHARSKRETFKRIIKTAIPIATGALVMSLGSLVDQIIIQRIILQIANDNPDVLYNQYKQYFPKEVFYSQPITIHTQLWGCYSASLTLMQLVTAVTQVFGSSAMPNVTSAWTRGNKDELKRSVETVIRMTMMFTLPMSFGLCVLAHPIMQFIYSSQAFIDIGGNVLTLMGLTTLFTASVTPICSMLQGIGKVSYPMRLYALCMVIKICTTWIFVSIPTVNIQGATMGSMIAYAVVLVIGMYLLIKHSKVIPNFFATVIKPFAGSLFSSATAYFANMLFSDLMPQRLSTIVSIILAVIVYIIALLVMRAFTANEIKFLPKGEKIVKLLEKYHLIG